MVFGLIGDILGGAARLTGSVIGLSLAVVAGGLDITKEMVKEAIDAGCETYEEVRDYWDLED